MCPTYAGVVHWSDQSVGCWRLISASAMLVVAALAPAAHAGDLPSPDGLVERDVAYATASDQQVLDVYGGVGQDGAAVPVVVLVHGGGWTSGDKATFAPAAQALAAHGFVVFNVNYRLDETAVPAYQQQVGDVREALAWVRANAARYGGDRGRIGLVGGSAGGYLVAMVATSAGPAETSGLRAAISLSGPMDIVSLVDYLRAARRDLGRDCRGAECEELATAVTSLRALLGCNPFTCPTETLSAASPLTRASASSPPFFLAHSRAEGMPASQARDMAARLVQLGVPVELRILAGREHSVEYLDVIGKSGIRFLERWLSQDAPRGDRPLPPPKETPWRLLGILALVGLAAAGALGVLWRLTRRSG